MEAKGDSFVVRHPSGMVETVGSVRLAELEDVEILEAIDFSEADADAGVSDSEAESPPAGEDTGEPISEAPEADSDPLD